MYISKGSMDYSMDNVKNKLINNNNKMCFSAMYGRTEGKIFQDYDHVVVKIA
jgi:hypothetical protein